MDKPIFFQGMANISENNYVLLQEGILLMHKLSKNSNTTIIAKITRYTKAV
jgi:hypothetical protein